MKRFDKSVWRETTFGELIEFHDHKRIPLSSKERASRQGDVPYYGASGVIDHIDGHIFDGPYLLISEDGENLNSRKTPIAFRANGRFWVNNHAHIVRGRPHVADDRFLEYLIAVTDISGVVTGAAQPKLSQANLRILKVCVPDYRTQTGIVDILSAYDELIRNSTRRISILEEMVRMIYREWFVNFRFPGHEGWPLITSDLGEIPKGWRVSRLVDVTTKIGSGATPRGGKESYQKEGIRLIRSLNIYDYRFEMPNLAFINDEQAEQLNNVTIEPNDVLLNITGASVGRCSMVPSSILPARVNQHVAIVRAKSATIDPFFLLDSINSDHNKQRLLGIAQGGATREALTKDSIAGFPILLPPLNLIRQYGQIAGLFHTQREKLNLRIENLRTTRDLLLPKLISGEVNVEQIETEAVTQGV